MLIIQNAKATTRMHTLVKEPSRNDRLTRMAARARQNALVQELITSITTMVDLLSVIAIYFILVATATYASS